ncbi:MGDG synthase family glycosyltransferase [Falsibacillus albus]|nr:glycosyltransferase [Falsibacillus albus]
MKKILIFSSDYGEGHKQAAHALNQETKVFSEPSQIQVMDFMQLVHPVMNPLFRTMFLKSISKFPSLYGFLYTKTSNLQLSHDMAKWSLFYARKVINYIDQFKPDVIVSTFPFASGCLSGLKSKGFVKAPIVTVITDFAHHRVWIHPYTDQYLVGAKSVADYLMNCGVDESKISITGIPIRKEEHLPGSKPFLKKRFELDPHKPVVLVMAGAYGLFGENMFTVLEEMAELPVQFVIVCGHNRKLYLSLLKKVPSGAINIKILGYTIEIMEYMFIADLLISKPGGLTISEAAANELPMLLFQSIPGQEEDNARFLLQNGAAKMASNPKELMKYLQLLMENKMILVQMKKNMRKLQKRNAAANGMKVILQLAQIGTSMEEVDHTAFVEQTTY